MHRKNETIKLCFFGSGVYGADRVVAFLGEAGFTGMCGNKNGCFLVSMIEITGCVAEETGSDQDFQKLTIPGRKVVLASLSLWHYDYDSYSAVGPKARTCCASSGYFVV